MADTKPEVVVISDIWQIETKFLRLHLCYQARTFHWHTSEPSATLISNGNSRWPPKLGTSGPLSVILKFGSRRTSDDVISVTIESGVVENVVLAVGISFVSYSVTRSNVLPLYRQPFCFLEVTWCRRRWKITPLCLNWPYLINLATKPWNSYENYTRLTDIPQLDILSNIAALSGFQPPFCFFFPATPDISVYDQ